MNKRLYQIAGVLAIMTLMLAGCKTSEFGLEIKDDSTAEIVAENAAKDSTSSVGGFTVKEGDQVVVEPSLKKGAITIQLIPSEEEAAPEGDTKDPTALGEPELELELTGTEPVECYPTGGDYTINAIVTEEASGKVVIKTVPSDLAAEETDSDSGDMVLINTEGLGQIAYAEEGSELIYADNMPAQSAQISLAEPKTYVLGAKADEGWKFVKWTKDGEDFSEEEQVTVELDSPATFVAVFDVEE